MPTTRAPRRARPVTGAATALAAAVLLAVPLFAAPASAASSGRTPAATSDGRAVGPTIDRLSSGSNDRTPGLPTTCRGEAVDDVVLPGEEWVGTAERDVVVVIGPDAEVWTNQGDDLVCVHLADTGYHGGGSHVVTSYGADTVITYGGDNVIETMDDADNVYLNGGVEEVDTGDGPDRVWATGTDAATVDAGTGVDLVVGGPGVDHLAGGDGDDVLLGAGGGDHLAGDAGGDLLLGGDGNDVLDGGSEVDQCRDSTGPAQVTTIACEVVVLSPAAPAAEAAG